MQPEHLRGAGAMLRRWCSVTAHTALLVHQHCAGSIQQRSLCRPEGGHTAWVADCLLVAKGSLARRIANACKCYGQTCAHNFAVLPEHSGLLHRLANRTAAPVYKLVKQSTLLWSTCSTGQLAFLVHTLLTPVVSHDDRSAVTTIKARNTAITTPPTCVRAGRVLLATQHRAGWPCLAGYTARKQAAPYAHGRRSP